MSRERSLLILFCVLAALAGAASLPAGEAPDHAQEIRLLFTGDILLSRQVQAELERKKEFPWKNFESLFREAQWVAGNFEGAVGSPDDCLPLSSPSPCFATPAASLALLRRAGFQALSIENNHAFDLGPRGREATREGLRSEGLLPLDFQDSPVFLRLGDLTVGIVALSRVRGRNGARAELPAIELGQKLRLARRLANVVIVSVHWGSELLDWPSDEQRRDAEWLVRQGADVIFGHHPHVVQRPECLLGKPVFYSLGNHLFDQKYPATKEGLIADCRIMSGKIRCGALATRTPAGTSFPQLVGRNAVADAALTACTVDVSDALRVDGYTLRPRPAAATGPEEFVLEAFKGDRLEWRSQPTPLVSLESGRLANPSGPETLFVLERRPSPIDGEVGVRPYVYQLGPWGLVARWRGSALAWPLLDATLLPGRDGVLCALHRRDSFVVLQPDAAGTRVAAYRWNGFGFSGIDDSDVIARCRSLFASMAAQH